MVGDFLRVYTKDVLHLDSTMTSRDEGAHGMIKRDLGSVNKRLSHCPKIYGENTNTSTPEGN